MSSEGQPGLTAAQLQQRVDEVIPRLEAKNDKKSQEYLTELRAFVDTKDSDLDLAKLNAGLDTIESFLDDNDDVDMSNEDQKNNQEKSEEKNQEKSEEKNQDKSEEKNQDKSEEKNQDKSQEKTAKGHGKSKTKIKKEPGSSKSNALFIPETESDSESEDEDPEYGRPLYYRPGPQPGDDVTTVGWAGGRQTRYINQYGPKNAATHRLDTFADSAEYEDELPGPQQVSNVHNRRGDERLRNNKFRFTKRHILGIYGVAWEGAGTGKVDDDLNKIDPDLVTDVWTVTYVLIAWDVDGEVEKKWEPRQALRARWGKKLADRAIYEAAFEAEDRSNEVKTGERRGTSRSPSVGLAAATAQRFREASLAATAPARTTRSLPLRAARSTPTPAAGSSGTKVSNATKAQWANTIETFKATYLQFYGVNSFQELDAGDQVKFMDAWARANPIEVA